MFIAKFFGSKRLAAAVGTIVAVLLVPVINAKLHLALDPTQVGEVVGAVVLAGVTFIGSQWHLDVSTGGDTSSSALLKAIAAPVQPALPPELASAVTLLASLAKPGSALADALKALESVPPPAAPPAVPGK
jgi:hypothetical protein